MKQPELVEGNSQLQSLAVASAPESSGDCDFDPDFDGCHGRRRRLWAAAAAPDRLDLSSESSLCRKEGVVQEPALIVGLEDTLEEGGSGSGYQQSGLEEDNSQLQSLVFASASGSSGDCDFVPHFDGCHY